MLEYYRNSVKDDYIRRVFEERLLGACNMQYIFYLALECTAEQKKEFIAFDYYLKNNFSEFYYRLDGKQIRFLRKTHFFGYRLVAWQKMRKDKKLKQNIFEGN